MVRKKNGSGKPTAVQMLNNLRTRLKNKKSGVENVIN